MHTSLDGFVAGPAGEMDWIHADADMFAYVGKQTEEADVALYGRVTYQMMEAYWPTAADMPDPTQHVIDHSRWYKQVQKVVMSTTLKEADLNNTKVISGNIADEINKLKQGDGKNILIIGSPGAAHELMAHNLIDDFMLFVNPMLLGKGIPMFSRIADRIKLRLVSSKVFSSGVVALHYSTS